MKFSTLTALLFMLNLSASDIAEKRKLEFERKKEHFKSEFAIERQKVKDMIEKEKKKFDKKIEETRRNNRSL